MTKNEWITELKKNTEKLPSEEQNRILEYYEELFSDKTESGMSEEEIINEFGNPRDVAEKLLNESPAEEEKTAFPQENIKSGNESSDSRKTEEKPKEEYKPPVCEKKKHSVGSTLAFITLLLLFGFVGLGILIAVWAVILSIVVVGASAAFAGIVQFFVSFTLFNAGIGAALAQLGISIFAAGIGFIILANAKSLSQIAIWVSRKIYYIFIGWYVSGT